MEPTFNVAPTTEPTTESVSSIRALCKADQFLDAFLQAEQLWGPWQQWHQPEQLELATWFLGHLGQDRGRTALMLKAFRRYPTNPDFCQDYLFYVLDKSGPIRMEQVFALHRHTNAQGKYGEADNLMTDAVLASERRDVEQARRLVDQVLQQHPDYLWPQRLRASLYETEQQPELYLQHARALFEQRPSLSTLNLLVSALRKNQRLEEARDVLWQHVRSYQSVRPWRQLLNICNKLRDFTGLEYALQGYKQLLRLPDRDEQSLLAANEMRLALHRGELARAQQYSRQTRGYYYQQVQQALAKATEAQLKPVLLPVPHVQQQHMTCAPATMTALCRYFGHEIEQADIVKAICYDGTPEVLERQWLTDHGYQFIERSLTEALCYALIDAKLPFAFVTTSGSTSHLQAVIGYDQAQGIAYLMDPGYDAPIEMLLAQSLQDEQASGARALIFVPKAQASRLTPFLHEEVAAYTLHDAYLKARYQRHLPEMQRLASALAEQFPEHQLTAVVQRSLAVELDDEPAIARCNLALLARFPEHVPWRLSYAQGLINQGQPQQAIDYLQQELQKRPHRELRLKLLSMIYRLRSYEPLTQSLRRQLERSGGYDARVYDLLADHDWHLKRYEQATRFYYLACCLDETNASYFDAHFKACLFLKRPEDGLTLARRHFEKFATRSAEPAKMLYRMLDLQKQALQGITVLQQARMLRPDDVDLYEFALGELLDLGRVDDFHHWLAAAKTLLAPPRYQYWLGREAEWRGELAKAAEFYRPQFELSPYNSRLAQSYLRVLKNGGLQAELAEVLARLAPTAADYPVVFDYLADYSLDSHERAKAIDALAQLFPHQVSRQQAFVKQCLRQQRLAAAAERVQQLLAEQPDHVEYLVLAARVAKANEALDDAAELLQRAIAQDVDHDDAFTLLMELKPSVEWKQQQFDYFLAQLQRQTVYGNGILDCWYEGRQFMSEAQRQVLIEQVLKPNLHLWQSRVVWAWLLQNQDLDQAILQVRLACDDFPLLPRPWLELAELLKAQGQVDEAIGYYQQALALNPAWNYASRTLATCLEEQGRVDEEVEVLQAALQHDSSNAVLYGCLADALIRQEQTEQALPMLERAVALDPDYMWGWRTLAKHRKSAGKDAYSQFKQLAEQVASNHPFAAGPWRILAEQASQAEQARGYWLQALERQPQNENIHQGLLKFELAQGEYQRMLDHLASHFPDERPLIIRELHSQALAEMGRTREAADLLLEYLAQSNADSYYFEQLFELLKRLEDRDTLLLQARRLASLNPHDAWALCRAGEALEWLKDASLADEIDRCYLRSAQLNPADRYIGLTWLDWLQQQKRWPEAQAYVEQLQQFHQDGWIQARKVRNFVALADDAALAAWRELLAYRVTNTWVHEVNLLVDSPLYPAMLEILAKELSNVSYQAGSLYAKAMLLTPTQRKQLERELPALELTAGVAGAWHALLEEGYEAQDRLPPKVLLEQQLPLWRDYPRLLQQAYVLLNQHQRSAVVNRSYAQLTDKQRSQNLDYQQLIALLLQGQLVQARQVAQQAVKRTKQSCYHNVLLWHAVLEGMHQPIDLSSMAYLDRAELMPGELWFADLLTSLAGQSAEQTDLWVLLRTWRRARPAVMDSLQVRGVKSLIKLQLPWLGTDWLTRLRLAILCWRL